MNVVAHNLSSMFTNRQLGITNNSKAKSAEKLSSGYKINRAADDAAGLSISEKMRKQIRGLNQGADNVQDGISFCQTADGYLEEVISMLQRMNELAIKAANGTNSESDRMDIDSEIQEIKGETKRIFKTAKFNEIKIFEVPYVPAPTIDKNYKSNLTELVQINSSFPPGASLDATSAASKHMDSSFTKNGITYQSASYIDFSGVNFSNLSALDDTGFFSTCCTCDNKYCISFDSSSSSSTVSGSQNFLYKVGIAGVTSASELVDRIVEATGGCPQSHYSNYEKDPNNANRLVVYDNRPNQNAGGDYGIMDYGVVKEITYKDRGDEIQVFSNGLDSTGNINYGGIEFNDVRHTWEELGVEIASDGKTFARDQVVDFHDYTGELVELHLKAGDPLSQVTRRNYWSADQNGAYINDVFAQSWSDIGITNEGNNGEYRIKFRQQEIWFEVNDGDTKSDVIDGINGKNLNVKYSWDIIASDNTASTAVSLFDVKSLKVSEANKNALDANYWISAYSGSDEDNSGLTILSSDGVAHTSTAWKDFKNSDGMGSDKYQEYPISDWGLTDRDGNTLSSPLVTFDDSATYTYTNTAQTDLNISFSFNLKDETGMDQAKAALDGVSLNKTFTADNVVTSWGGASSEGGTPKVRLNTTSLSYDIQKIYGRDFDDPAATMEGTVNRVMHTTSGPDTDYTTGSEAKSTTLNGSSSSVVYVKQADGTYLKSTKTVKNYTVDSSRTDIQIDKYDAYYSYESPVFNGNGLDSIADGNAFNYYVKTERQFNKTENRVDTQYADTSERYIEQDIQDMITKGDSIVTEDAKAAASVTTIISDWAETGTVITKRSTANDSFDLTSDKGYLGTLTVSDSNRYQSVSDYGNASLNFKYDAKGYAYCDFDATVNGYNSGNKNDAIHFWKTGINIPDKELPIQTSSNNPDYIPLRWSGLNNAIIGIQTTNTASIESARDAIDEVSGALRVVSQTRAVFGAEQNRLEHAYKINNNTSENTQAAESIIRDTDMALEMVKYSKENILQQAGQSMLAQAQHQPQSVLQLLQ